jgi:hypothetical protein
MLSFRERERTRSGPYRCRVTTKSSVLGRGQCPFTREELEQIRTTLPSGNETFGPTTPAEVRAFATAYHGRPLRYTAGELELVSDPPAPTRCV